MKTNFLLAAAVLAFPASSWACNQAQVYTIESVISGEIGAAPAIPPAAPGNFGTRCFRIAPDETDCEADEAAARAFLVRECESSMPAARAAHGHAFCSQVRRRRQSGILEIRAHSMPLAKAQGLCRLGRNCLNNSTAVFNGGLETLLHRLACDAVAP